MKTRIILVFIIVSIIFLMHTVYADWEQIYSFPNALILSRASIGNNLFLGLENGIYKSTDNGNTWNFSNSGLSSLYINALCVDNGNIYAGTNDGLYYSTDNGDNWNLLSLKNNQVYKVAVNGQNICLTYGESRRVYFSTNNGEIWNKVIDRTDYLTTGCLFITTNKNNFYCSFVNLGLYSSIDNGKTWRFGGSGLGDTWLNSFAFSDSKVFVGTERGVYVSMDSGYTFKGCGFLNDGVSVAIYGNALFAATSAGVYISNDDGVTWQNIGLSNIDFGSIFIHSNILFASIYNPVRVWIRPLSEVSPVDKIIPAQPIIFVLRQNFPNPFNPVTTINFSIPTSSFTTLKIYDMLGRELSTIVNDNLNIGEYTKEWNAGNYSSGIYFYTLQSGRIKLTKKLILQK